MSNVLSINAENWGNSEYTPTPTVRQLIEKLKEYDEGMRVVVKWDDGLTSIELDKFEVFEDDS